MRECAEYSGKPTYDVSWNELIVMKCKEPLIAGYTERRTAVLILFHTLVGCAHATKIGLFGAE